MTIEEHKEFPVDSASLKEVRNFAREVLAKDPIFQSTSDDVVLALAEAAQNIVKHAYSCLLYTSPSPRDLSTSRMPSSA